MQMEESVTLFEVSVKMHHLTALLCDLYITIRKKFKISIC